MCNPNWTALQCILATFLAPLLLIVVGVIAGLIGLLSQNLTAEPDKTPLIEFKKITIYRVQINKMVRCLLQYIGLVLLVVGIGWILYAQITSPIIARSGGAISPSDTPNTAPSAHLSGVGFMIWDWQPYWIDLRTSNRQGINAEVGAPLRIFGVTVFADEDINRGYKVQVELLANNSKSIGYTQMVTLQPGYNELGDVEPTDYLYSDTLPGNWRIQEDWDELTVVVKVYDHTEETELYRETTHIKLVETGGQSWWLEPPYASLAMVVFQINQEEKQTVDLRTIKDTGIEVQPGDTLRIWEIWYRSPSENMSKNICAEV